MENQTLAIAARLKKARIEAGYYSAREFVNKFNLSASTYSHHETGKRAMSIDVIKKYCKMLNIHPAWLITGEESYKEYQSKESLTKDEIEQSIKLPHAAIQNQVETIDKELLTEIIDQVYQIFSNDLNAISFKKIVGIAVDIYYNTQQSTMEKKLQLKIISSNIESLKQGFNLLKKAAGDNIS